MAVTQHQPSWNQSISNVIQPWILHFSLVIILCPDKFCGQWSEVSALLVLQSMNPHLTTVHLVIAGNKTSGSAWNTASFFYYRTRYCRTKKLSVYLGLSTCTFAIWTQTSVCLSICHKCQWTCLFLHREQKLQKIF